jgi:hypothetical protein
MKNPWKDAVIEACIASCVDFDENDAQKTLNKLIAWEVQVALDPRVSEAAHDLITGVPGAVRYKRDEKWIVTNPHDALYSAALFAAEEVFTENGWESYSGETKNG